MERNRILVGIEDGQFRIPKEIRKRTLMELIERYEKGHQDKIASAKQEAEIRWWKSHLGARRLFEITPVLVAEYRDRLKHEITIRNKPRSNGSVRRHLAVLSHILNVAVKEFGWMQENPIMKVKKPKEASGSIRFLSQEERERLLKACRESSNLFLYPVTILALSTGMRQGEIMNLHWSDVDLHNGRIILLKTKNKESRRVPLGKTPLQMMRDLNKVRRKDTALLFPSNENPKRPMDLRFPWEKALRVAGIENFRFHDCRHSAASELAMNGASLAEIAEILGHKTLAMVKRYAHLSESHTAKVVESMNEKIFG